ncbi:TonB-dependent siderophore receptor [Chitiniphilus purpureus]|uniref:TonB-dependent siderophore receptor n=1 Tax=Chitiniphilus purpureus TaxID=2981137 RepID=A0ABY6DMS4_9NEIS|nr:TonB-dependent siderophore receptor [Chitiniphilus sp. CD1]UXY15513.1 TonB-dependent siderophore receptor [Chitiniphilus sp. CD1]
MKPSNLTAHAPLSQPTPLARAVHTALLGIALSATAAHAEEPTAAPTGETTLPTVVVKAAAEGSAANGYRVARSALAGSGEQALVDTPFSIKVLPAELLADQKIDSIAGLDRLDASVTSATANPGWYSSPAIRGFALDNASNFRYNGLMVVNQQATGLENKERVELLKGLSALQSGFAAPGGLINYVTKRPDAQPVNDLNLSVNEYGNYKTHADVSRRSEDGRFGVRVNAAYEDERSYVREVDGKRRFVALALDGRVTDNTVLQLDVEHERRNQHGQPSLDQDVNGDLPRDFDPRTFLGQSWARYPTEFTLISGKLEHFVNEQWSVALDANWMRLTRDQNQIWSIGNLQPNGDGDVFLYYAPDQKREPVNGRATLQGRFETGGIGHELTLGASVHRHKLYWGDSFWGGIGSTNIHQPTQLANPEPAVAGSGLAQRTREEGLFFNDVLSFGQNWKLHLGGRYAQREQTGYNTNTGAVTSHYEKDVFSPNIALVYKPLAHVSTYVSYVEGLEQGGIAPANTTNANEQMAPLTSEQWEAGVKAELGAGLTAELALFRIDKPAEYTRINDNGSRTFVQDGLRRHQGVELSLAGNVAREWTVFASAMLLDAELKDTGNPNTQGKRPADTPRQRASLIAQYSPQALAGWAFMGSWTHTGERPVNNANTGQSAAAYNVFGLGARYDTRFGTVPATLRVNVDNLFDKRYWADADDVIAGAPRTVSASLGLKF